MIEQGICSQPRIQSQFFPSQDLDASPNFAKFPVSPLHNREFRRKPPHFSFANDAHHCGRVFLLRMGRDDDVSSEERKMKVQSLKRWVLAAVVFCFVVGLCDLSAQEAATALSSVQQSAAKSALCSAIASKFPNPSLVALTIRFPV
jgi:hypothetical protein